MYRVLYLVDVKILNMNSKNEAESLQVTGSCQFLNKSHQSFLSAQFISLSPGYEYILPSSLEFMFKVG